MIAQEPDYFCADCGWEGDEPVCAVCGEAAESLTYDKESDDDEDREDNIGYDIESIENNDEEDEY